MERPLAGGLAAPGGAHTTVEFKGEVELTHFTIASADDRPERDPVAWQILGSTDGVVFTPIFTQTDPAGLTIWTQRLQVVRATLPAAAPKYRYLRFACTSAGDGWAWVPAGRVPPMEPSQGSGYRASVVVSASG